MQKWATIEIVQLRMSGQVLTFLRAFGKSGQQKKKNVFLILDLKTEIDGALLMSGGN